MYFIDEVWDNIKKYIFHRHLWIENQYKRELMFSIPRLNKKTNYPMMVVSNFIGKDRFIKMYDYVQNISITTIMYIPENISKEEFDQYINLCWNSYSYNLECF